MVERVEVTEGTEKSAKRPPKSNDRSSSLPEDAKSLVEQFKQLSRGLLE